MEDKDIFLGDVKWLSKEGQMNLSEAVKVEREARSRDKGTKYTDADVKDFIEMASNMTVVNVEKAKVYAMVAQAMVMYNNMIDKRWG